MKKIFDRMQALNLINTYSNKLDDNLQDIKQEFQNI